MSDPSWIRVSHAGTPANLRLESLIQAWNSPTTSPIDEFLNDLRVVITAATPDLIQNDPRAASMLVVRVIGNVESYIRSVLSRAACICPRARSVSDSSQVTLFAARRYVDDFLALTALEGSSLADAGEIKKRTRTMLGIEVKQGSDLDEALREFSKACHFRHAVAHAAGVLSARNMLALGVTPPTTPQQFAMTVAGLQEISAVCETAVRTYNRHIFQRLIEGWLGDGTLTGSWQNDEQLFEPTFRLFYSAVDNRDNEVAPQAIWREVMRIS